MRLKSWWAWGIVAALACGSTARSADDEVLIWNSMLLDTYRSMGGCPCPLSRIGALTSVAVFEAVNSIDGSYEPYLASLPASSTASKEAAVATAAHDVLVAMFPALQGDYDARLIASLAAIPDGPEKTEGMSIGQAAALQIMAARQNDGWNGDQSYTPGNTPGSWHPTWPDFIPPCSAHWGHCTPWGMTSGDQFRPVGSYDLASVEYAHDFNEIKTMGNINWPGRPAEHYTIAYFWANDRDGTYKPPGHLDEITAILSRQFNLSLVENARLFALVNMSMADAGIAAWDEKYLTSLDLWRPIEGIRKGDLDGNPLTDKDGGWVPLNTWSPPFPAYISGHATFGAVHAAILRNYFGTDNVAFTCGTDDPKIEEGVTRTFSSFSSAALENGRSRVYLGVHWQQDSDRGYTCGTQIGDWIYSHYMRPATSAILDPATAVAFGIASLWPNPSQGDVTLNLVLPQGRGVDLGVFDATGRAVRRWNGVRPDAGANATLRWDGKTSDGARVPAGVYFVRSAVDGASSSSQVRLVILP